jgi:diacylglycerol kinase (ATP)
MEQRPGFSLKDRVRSFGNAFRGLRRLVVGEHNAWIHAALTLIVITVAALLHVSADDWCWLIAAIGLVWICETFNTAIECLGDALTSQEHPVIRDAKDLAAGAVLLAAMTAGVIGVVRFAPYLIQLVS